MSVTRNGAHIATNISARTLSEISAVDTVRLSFDLVSAARRNIGFLRAVSESQWLHDTATVVEAIRRYDELWMPMISDLMVGSTPPMVLPPFDIEWVWFCHTLNPTYPTVYAEDMKEMEVEILGKIMGMWETLKEKEVQETKEVWEKAFDQPYEKAGGTIDFHGLAPVQPPVYWETTVKAVPDDKKHNFLRLRMLRCHRELKIDKPISSFSLDSWKKASQLYYGVVASITPPVQAPYLLKCVPDRVTDNSGAMISDVILRMNHYKPQEGRWLSRTVLDHAGRECFVVRIRVGGGFWRRGGETPSAVKWEDRIIEVREGSWSYVAGSIGRAPEDNPTGRATALLNWKLLIVEILPEEDAVLAILICISILRSVSEMRKEDVGSLLIRRRIKEAKLGTRDWGSVILHPSSCSSSISSPYLQPWYWNPKAVITSDRGPNVTRQPTTNYSPVEGGDKLYKRGIIT
ncbi:hypothetical protein GH714_005764 [Hevea brasiliensis]|uniref:GRPD C-terminal domain-containing protein n=1 Tax=Hevea brasiliensis TaxID=3981 RepID=A0A6A6KIX4_HEVBR|nr:hypothetical protein GH714_005764 [Hevea brasiliensis]